MKRHVLFLFCVLFVHTTFSARNLSSSRSNRNGLEISCTVSQKNKPVSDYRILIIENDTVFTTISADLTEPVYIQLDLNKSYVLEFSKPGFLERLVLVDTRVPQGKTNGRFSYDFEIELPVRYNDTGFYAVQPIARIIYDTTKDKFGYDVEYARNIGNIPVMISSTDAQGEKSPAKGKRNRKKVERTKL